MATSRFGATRRVLGHFFWARMRGGCTRIRIALADGAQAGDITARAAEGRVTIEVTPRRPGWLSTDLATSEPLAPAAAPVSLTLAGLRHLIWVDAATGDRFAVPLYRRRNHVAAALRAGATLALFPVRHRGDMIGYFLRGDSAAGDRMERALLPRLAPADVVPRGAEGIFGPAPLPPIDAPVDIVLPVYNAVEVLRSCLDRLAGNTPEPHRIVLIDDASTDPAIRPLLEAFVRRHPRARLLVNPANLGFVGTVNRGLAEARGHVVLLNSDALVPPGWLSRLMAPILTDPSVGSVTPLSSDAEIFSAPVECRARSLGPDEALAADRIAGRLDWRRAQADAPVGVGFCMAMARPWLDRVPGFDPVFGRGYGEEVDWCRRTAALGARHIGLGSLYVEHRSGSSFGAEKAERIRHNNRIVAQRHPGYDLLVQRFRNTDPLAGPRLAVGLGLLDRGDRVPVYLAHRLGGGAELWLRARLAEDLAAGGVALVLRDAKETGRTLVELHCAQGVTRALCAPAEVKGLLAIPARRHLIYSNLVEAQDPLAFLQTALAALGPEDRLTLLFHDFLPLCPSYSLIGAEGRYCGLPADAAACQSCYGRLAVTSGARPARIADWRAGWRAAAGRAEELVVFSADSRAHLLRVWPDLADRITLAPHRPGHLPRRVRPPASGGGLTLGVLGSIGHAKGAALLRDLAGHSGPGFRLVVIGRLDPAFSHPAILVHGGYGRDEIADLAERYGITSWLIPSIWPETFCYAVHECLATGLPVMGFDLGAQAEALRRAPHGIVLPEASVAAVLRACQVAGPAHRQSRKWPVPFARRS